MREKKRRNILTEVFAGETRLKLSRSLKNPCTKKEKEANIKYSRIRQEIHESLNPFLCPSASLSWIRSEIAYPDFSSLWFYSELRGLMKE